MREIREQLPGGLEIDWRYFSLEQVNQRAGEGVDVWDRPDGYESTGLDAFAAVESARRRGDPALWERLHAGLLEVRHTGKREKLTREVVLRVAEAAGLDKRQLEADLDNPEMLQPLAEQHAEGMREGVFGTPTLFFENGQSGYLKMLPAPTGEEALRAWTHVQSLVQTCDYIAEVKRPKKPKTA